MTLQRYQNYQPGDNFSDMSAGLLQHGQDQVRQFGNINVGPGIQLRKTPSGTSITVNPDEFRPGVVVPAGLEVVLLFVTNVDLDTLEGKESMDDQETIVIAKPLDLQQSSYLPRTRVFQDHLGNDVTVTYTAPGFPSSGNPATQRVASVSLPLEPTVAVVEMITPPYAILSTDAIGQPSPDKIVAVKVGEDITQVEGVDWIDWNLAGRAWAEVKEEGE